MITAPIPMPSTVPSGPASGRKVVPGIMNEPQPTAQPRDKAQAPSGVRKGRGVELFCFIKQRSFDKTREGAKS